MNATAAADRLRFIAFIVHQYLSIGDALILTLRHAV